MPDAEEFADVSSHQAGTDLAAYARAGRRRVLLKATEGTTYTSPYFAAWWRLGGTLGLCRGGYHFARPSTAVALGRSMTSGAAAEAARFASAVRAVGGLTPYDWVCLDLEDPRETGPRAATHAAVFCHRMAELGFPHGKIYSYTPYLTGIGLRPDMLPPGWRWLHIANYGPAADSRVPLPPGWGRELLAARQYSESAAQAGIPGRSDANRVVREWLPALVSAAPEEDVVTDKDKMDIARLVLEQLRGQVFDVTPPIRQGNAGNVIGATYNKVGDVQSTLADLKARGDFFYDQLAKFAPACGVELDPPPWRTA